MKQPLWFKLLEENRKARYGLTLPFLFGAYLRQGVETDISEQAVEKLVASIAEEAPDGVSVTLRVCDRLEEPVFTSVHAPYKPSQLLTKVPGRDGAICTLYVEPKVMTEKPGSIAELAEVFWSRYQTELQEERFSYSQGRFVQFAPEDHALIDRAASREDEEWA
ncbi:hypothetical protein [Sedimenticola selenatireducens]|uniref:hypothetical protein n=1 Tax=Sedimenticola selenatireducens TaxID=191960 RepID=UPI002AAB6D35|nr:hypothetical protein [Sedimenticola selenatireducens]